MNTDDKLKLEEYIKQDPHWVVRLKELYWERVFKDSSASQNVMTPETLCKEMIGKLRENCELSNKKILTLNVEFVNVLGNEDITFFSDCPKKSKYVRGFFPNVKVIEGDFLKWETTMKFDNIVMNPPYKQNLHLAFLKKSVDLIKDSGFLVSVQPSMWLLSRKQNEVFRSAKDKIENGVVSFELRNLNSAFGIGLFMPCVITVYHKKQNKKIKVIDTLQNKTFEYDSINDVNKFGDIKEYFTSEEKVMTSCKKDNVLFHTKDKGRWYVSLAQIRGNVDMKTPGRMFTEDFYTFVPKDLKISPTPHKHLNFGFATENEANNFLKYLKTYFARFCLAIYKCNSQLDRNELASVPWLDFTQEWTDDRLFKKFNLSKEEIDFVYKAIPKYYEV